MSETVEHILRKFCDTDYLRRLLPLGGRTRHQNVPDGRHLFGSYGDPAAAGAYPTVGDGFSAIYTPPVETCYDGTRLWQVSSAAREIQRYVAPPGTLSPLSFGQVFDRNPPAGASISDRTALKLRVSISGAGYKRQVVIDIGQPLEVYADAIAVSVLGPDGTVEVPPDNVTASGLVFDTIVGARVVALEESQGSRDAYFTETFQIPSGTALIREIPPGARELVGYSDSDIGANWDWLVGGAGPASPWVIGELPWIADGTISRRRTFPESVVPGATHLRTDNFVVSDRYVSLVWKIRP